MTFVPIFPCGLVVLQLAGSDKNLKLKRPKAVKCCPGYVTHARKSGF